MKCKTVVLWWLVNKEDHPLLTKEDKKLSTLISLATALFPGIDCSSFSGLSQAMNALVVPTLKKRYPELLTTSEADIEKDATTDVVEMLASDGYEWQNDTGWMTKFQELLTAA